MHLQHFQKQFPWTAAATKELIVFFRDHENLYNPKNEFYKNRILRDKHLRSISGTVGYTPEEAKARFRNLRTYFFREDQKVTASKPSEAGSTCGGPQYRSQWEFFEDLTFLRSCHHPRARTASTGSGSVDDSSDETDLATANDESSSTASGGSGVQGVVCVGGGDDAAKVSAALPQEPPTKKRRTQLEAAAEDFGREEREPTSSALCWHESTTNDGSTDENYHFAMMIAQELRHMEPIKRDMLKLRLFDTMLQAKHNVMLQRSVSSALNLHCNRN